jgi:hypothetical protein
MVKVGFIVEGGSEQIIIQSEQFKMFLMSKGYELVTPVVDAKGGGNLLPQNINVFIEILERKSVDQIFILTDLEDDLNTQLVRQRVSHAKVKFVFVAVKALEAWFLADTAAMKSWLKDPEFYENTPEHTQGKPWDRLKEIAAQRDVQGPGNKISFAKRIIKHWGFSLENAAQHPNCPSAAELNRYFE